jgi:hypothetical protein
MALLALPGCGMSDDVMPLPFQSLALAATMAERTSWIGLAPAAS